MTFYERQRNRKTGGMIELPVGSRVVLEDSVVNRKRVSRVAHVVDPNTLRIEHHLFGFPGIQLGGWPLTREYVGEQVHNARYWKQMPDGSGELPEIRIIWRPTPIR